jgi:WD40 repeat protein/transcriptional regulator with XRE-family HTH domain
MATFVQPLALDSFSTFGDLLKYLRRRERLTQLELSIAVGYSEAQISRLEKNQRLPDLTALKALFLPALHLEKDPTAAAQLLELAQSARQEDAPAPGVAPYKGLLFFDEADAEWFFGREALTERLCARVNSLAAGAPPRLLAVVGASGGGKSSLVRAGLAVELKRIGLDTRVFTPTAEPLKSLPGQPARADRNANSTRVVWLVDQFEEVFTLCREDAARAAFVERLLAAANEPDGLTTVVIALRADFYSHCAQFPRLREGIASQQEFIGQMSEEELRRAIEDPAKRGGWMFEPGLVDTMLRDIGAGALQDQEPGALPLLSHALLVTWERRRGRTLTLEGYRASGGVQGAIAETAESVFADRLDQRQRQYARDIFLRLTELGEGTEDTRRRAALTELVPDVRTAAELRGVLNTLADARLVILGEDSAEVAHEALIREWQRLREWLHQDRDGLRLHRQLTQAAREWEVLQRDTGAMYRGARLEQVLEWAAANPSALNAQERAFLDASKESAEREAAEREVQRRRELEAAQELAEEQKQRAEEKTRAAHLLHQRAFFLASALGLAIVLAFIALFFGEQGQRSAVAAQANADRAEQERRLSVARELAATAVSNLDVDPERSILLALQAVSIARRSDASALNDAEEALHRAVITSRLRFTLSGHTKSVSALSFSPDGKRLATLGDDGLAKVWDTGTGRELFTLKTGFASSNWDAVHGIAFSPDGKFIGTVIRDNGDTVAMWNASTGSELPMPFCCHNSTITSITFSRDGTRLATTSLDGTARVWEVSTRKTLRVFSTGRNAVAFSPDGTRLVTDGCEVSSSRASSCGAVVWDVSTGEKLLTLGRSIFGLGAVVFSPDGTQIATARLDGTAQVWDSTSGQLLHTLIGHFGSLTGIAFSGDGKLLATASLDGTAIIWDTDAGSQLLVLRGHSRSVLDIAFSPDGKSVATASGDATVRIWDVSPEGSREWLTFAGHPGSVYDVRYSPDGKRIASVDEVGGVQVWDSTTGQVLLKVHLTVPGRRGIAFSPDGKRLAVADETKDTQVWDSVTGKILLTLYSTGSYSYTTPGSNIDYSADGKYIGMLSGSGLVRVWSAASGRPVPAPPGLASAIAFSPDGKHLAMALAAPGADKTNIVDTQTWKTVLSLSRHTGLVNSIAYSPDSARIVTAGADGTARVWDAGTGKELFTLYSHTSGMNSAAFSPDGKYLAVAVARGIIQLWDLSESRQPDERPISLYGHTLSVEHLAFSPDGKRLATASNDGTVRIDALALDDLIAIAKSRVTRTLTADECQVYLHMQECPSMP